MRTHRSHLSRADLERMLDGQAAHPAALAQLLSAARATGTDADSAGLQAALAVHASISPRPVTIETSRRRSMMKTLAAKLLAAKLLTLGGVAVAATGGVALSAWTGHLPDPLPHSSHASDTARQAVAAAHPGAPSSTSATAPSSSSAPDSDTASAGPSATATSARPAGTPSPSLVGLCHSWLARPHLMGKADQSPAFTVLVTAAGGTSSVNAYCTRLLAATPSASATGSTPSSTHPSHPSHPSHPTGKPSTVPSASHPTGEPSTVPSASHSTGH
jgi:hypothetical protein